MKDTIKVILITLIISIVIVIIKDQYQYLLLNKANYGMATLIKKGNINNLFVGSSMFRQGLDPAYLDDNSYILSYNGNQPMMEEWLLNHLIDNNLKINNLYLDLYPYILNDEPKVSDGKIFMEMDINGKWKLYKLFYNNDFASFYNIFVSENNESLITWPIYYKLVNSTYLRGGVKDGRDGLTLDEINELDIPDTNKNINKQQEKAVINIINICKKNNINLVFIETPKYKKIANDENYQYLLEYFINILDNNNVKYIRSNDIEDSISDNPINYVDLIHLSNEGRSLYTKLLMEKIRN